ncbi:ferritin-like domain-containing protein [Desulfovibrio litoralis]|uniref:Rubrerythrin n=1 Tax=Desulfovibrio litoralis DSM 11393 TaxID=1121455 RepID=A0A1M7T433_9BACT|nr:ferritin family protein [Desulfovibrio litoralis]SHN65451.1 Rubrerythrin [Desulfovibrio litoralis DSM 11393]
MANFFKASEIANTACEIERKGQEFYRKAAEAANDEESRKFFAFFSVEETRHEKIFQDMVKRLGGVELPTDSNDEEYALYIKSLVDSHSIFDSETLASLEAEQLDVKKAVRKAMSFEKDTIVFFVEMKRLVPESEQKFIDECIEEERKHLRMLAKWLI